MSDLAKTSVIRRATPDDAAFLQPLRHTFWLDQISKGLLDVPALDEASLHASTAMLLKRPRTATYIAQVDNAIAGYVTGNVRLVPGAAQSSVATVDELFVDTTYRIPTLAFSLMRTIIDELVNFGATRIQARILHNNKQSIEFTEFIGFRANLIYYEYDMSLVNPALSSSQAKD